MPLGLKTGKLGRIASRHVITNNLGAIQSNPHASFPLKKLRKLKSCTQGMRQSPTNIQESEDMEAKDDGMMIFGSLLSAVDKIFLHCRTVRVMGYCAMQERLTETLLSAWARTQQGEDVRLCVRSIIYQGNTDCKKTV